jgi:hypothetical protein
MREVEILHHELFAAVLAQVSCPGSFISSAYYVGGLVGDSRKGKGISVTGLGGPYGFETSRLPHILDQ